MINGSKAKAAVRQGVRLIGIAHGDSTAAAAPPLQNAMKREGDIWGLIYSKYS